MSQFPVINSGTALTAQVLNWMLPLVGFKSANQSVTNSTAYVADTALTVPVEANATYTWEAFVIYDGGTQGSSDLKIEPITTGLTLAYTAEFIGTSGTASADLLVTPPVAAGTNGVGVYRVVRLRGTVIVGSAAEHLTLQWAQVTANATATTIYANSWLTARRIA